jgi:hypothetical protein
MTRARLRLFAVTALLSFGAVAFGGNESDKALQDIAAHRKWTRLNQKPIAELSYATGG